MFELRDYQTAIVNDAFAAWQSVPNVLAVLATGGGKTVILSHIIRLFNAPAIAIAHRQELVGQISLALARVDLRHRIIAPKSVIRDIVRAHMEECGKSFYDPSAIVGVAGVDTLVSRHKSASGDPWLQTVKLWVQDEAHHVRPDNKWGTACAMFPNAKGLGVTATPLRADRGRLDRVAGGLFDHMIEGPTMRDLINRGFLTEYRIFAPPSDLKLDTVQTSKTTGDYNAPQLRAAVAESHIVGDVVAHYIRISAGKRGITFVTDVETAKATAAAFNLAGVPAAWVSAKTPDSERRALVRRFRNGDLLQLVNVDLFGEGVDIPAVEVVSMARPTQSYGLYVQQFGRALRIIEGKQRAIIIDHVSNVVRHGLPDAPRDWGFGVPERKSKKTADDDIIPLTTCTNVECLAVYERTHAVCPFCNEARTLPNRDALGPARVDGDLTEMTAAELAELRGEVIDLEKPPEQYRAELAAKHAPLVGQLAGAKRFAEAQDAQRSLRDMIAQWAGYQRALGAPDADSYRIFYYAFGVDVATAQTLKTKEAESLTAKIITHMESQHGYQANIN